MIEKMLPDEEAWIEEVKRRKKLKEPGIPAERMKLFRKLLAQKVKETGTLDRAYVDELLERLKRRDL